MEVFMKRISLILLVFILLFQLVACKNDPPTGDTESESASQSETQLLAPDIPEEPKITIDDIKTYENNIIKTNDKDTWTNYGVGDPFVMRYNGRYYLYCSTKSGQIGIQCWVSDDLVNWAFTGMCATETLTNTAYAPEVYYYNGSFYMYTSPGGKGHYVLQSDSPTGPFVAVTDNFGLWIDGSVFIDDDGSWYFYCAGEKLIHSYVMTSPTEVDKNSLKNINLDAFGWTEGPMAVKYDDMYYLTYCGNHVYCPAYRVHCAIGTYSPRNFTPVGNNPLVVSTDRSATSGTGHSSTVLGPNLDEYYLVYHTFQRRPHRNMSIDRIIFNGSQTVVLGPTATKQQAPTMPNIYSRFTSDADLEGWTVSNGSISDGAYVLSAGGRAISSEKLAGDYTAEYNLLSTSDKAGILFSYVDEQNYGRATYDAAASELTVDFVSNGQTTQHKVALTASFSDTLRSDVLNVFRICKRGSTYTFYVNSRKVFSGDSDLGDGAIGVFCEAGTATIGFVGGTNGSFQSTLSEVYKPAEIVSPAFSTLSSDAEIVTHDKAKYLHAVAGGSYAYRTNVSRDDKYDFVIEYRSEESCVLDVYLDNVKLGEISLSPSPEKDATVAARGFDMNACLGRVTLFVKEGSADILGFYFHESDAIESTVSYEFENSSEITYSDGEWKIADGKLSTTAAYGKCFFGEDSWHNYVVEGDITFNSDSHVGGGLCVRTSNPAYFAPNERYSYHLQGYYVLITRTTVILQKCNFNYKELAAVSFKASAGQTYNIKVEANENTITVSLDGNVIMTYTDTDDPFLHGMVGYKSEVSEITVENLKISPLP